MVTRIPTNILDFCLWGKNLCAIKESVSREEKNLIKTKDLILRVTLPYSRVNKASC